MKIAIYKTDGGLIDRFITCPPDHVAIQCGEGEEFYLNCPYDATHIIDNLPVNIPPPIPSNEELLLKIRQERNIKLSATDYTQLNDVTVDKEAWATYRQALRDFPDTCDIENPIWPTPPK